ncbi:sensor histidine kinase [Pigmentiphaga litoralis]|uniref:Two-component sensor histidine kinase n=1 Tax=Pigmentiphaga litoralis TaxID=516702 RepID=A0A7Y9IST1_9BURK|nr:two-component sensor histidine kinase [Pigmentiphaga litoralis]NYE81724.1 two-component sensor histidine kinase [Pigmentiphaga litoralis]
MISTVTQSFIGMPADQEARRLDAVRRYDILDTPPDGAFDSVTALAARLLDVPIAIISIVDTDRIWFKSHHGLDVEQIPRDAGLCASAILHDDAWVLTDARFDPRAMTNPLVASEFGLRFYAGVPLHTSDGHNLGTLCVLDKRPRGINRDQIGHLSDLASVVMDQLELRLSARRAIDTLSTAVAEKEAALAHADVMAQEVDHRVMNSLQLITTMLEIQAEENADNVAGHEIGRAAGRVAAIARVHQHIQLSEDYEGVQAVEYLDHLCEDISDFVGGTGHVHVTGSPVYLSTDNLVSLGLVVNELVINAMKQGAHHVTVCLEPVEGGLCELKVDDDGPGIASNFDPARSTGMGMKVVSSLARRLRATLSFGRGTDGKGASICLRFPIVRDAAPRR